MFRGLLASALSLIICLSAGPALAAAPGEGAIFFAELYRIETSKSHEQYSVSWIDLRTGNRGYGKCMGKELAHAWVKVLNEKYRGEIEHFSGRCT